MTREEIQKWERKMRAEIDSMTAEGRRIHEQTLGLKTDMAALDARWARFETELLRVEQLAKAAKAV